MNATNHMQYREILLEDLLGGDCCGEGRADPNRTIFAGLAAGRAAGLGCLPGHLGLGKETFSRVWRLYFPNSGLVLTDGKTEPIPEWEDLYGLLTDHRAGAWNSELWVAHVVATACAGRDHLWQDLGFSSRDELSQLMRVNFPSLVRENSGDMKWKKFLYRQFCARDGIYVCPAPSCAECADRAKCFAPET
ncbi:MAG: nitrogen fixation protein NifQ [Rhodocyclaceae bacterium]|nr:nitrogen fixation protein NifQ [Rhodocyclaceae bacterium]